MTNELQNEKNKNWFLRKFNKLSWSVRLSLIYIFVGIIVFLLSIALTNFFWWISSTEILLPFLVGFGMFDIFVVEFFDIFIFRNLHTAIIQIGIYFISFFMINFLFGFIFSKLIKEQNFKKYIWNLILFFLGIVYLLGLFILIIFD